MDDSSPSERVSAVEPDTAILATAGQIIRTGGIVAFPTETVYGLGANALDRVAVGRVFHIKGRPARNPIIVHIAELDQVSEVCGSWPSIASDLARRFWPGPLTLVLPKAPRVPDLVTAGRPTVAVRMPAHAVALGLIRASGVPIAAPSANRSGQISPTTAEHVQRGLGGLVDLVLDAGPTHVGIESTVLDLSSRIPRILRPGNITAELLESLIGPMDQGKMQQAGDDALPSPGLLRRHYAPRTKLECLVGSRARVLFLADSGMRVGWLTHATDEGPPPGVVRVDMPDEPHAYAARLYAELHRLDALDLERIVVESPSRSAEWRAVADRLERAAAEE